MKIYQHHFPPPSLIPLFSSLSTTLSHWTPPKKSTHTTQYKQIIQKPNSEQQHSKDRIKPPLLSNSNNNQIQSNLSTRANNQQPKAKPKKQTKTKLNSKPRFQTKIWNPLQPDKPKSKLKAQNRITNTNPNQPINEPNP